MRGYFGIGIDGATKGGNVGNLIRTAHAFGANFGFVLAPDFRDPSELKSLSDTAKSADALPFFVYEQVNQIERPVGCRFVGVEIDDRSVDLPSFRHPTRAVYILGGERLGLSDEMREACDDIIKIPTKFSLNVATAGAIVMYDRVRLMGGFAQRPVMPGQSPIERKPHVSGGPKFRTRDL